MPSGGVDGADCALVLRAVSHAASQFPPAEAEKLSQQLQRRLGAFNLAPGAAGAHAHALMTLTKTASERRHGGADNRGEAPEWFRELSASAGVVMGAYVKGHGVAGGPRPPSDEKMTAAMFTVGEIAVQCNIMPPADCQTFIQALVAPGLVPAAGEVFSRSFSDACYSILRFILFIALSAFTIATNPMKPLFRASLMVRARRMQKELGFFVGGEEKCVIHTLKLS